MSVLSLPRSNLTFYIYLEITKSDKQNSDETIPEFE